MVEWTCPHCNQPLQDPQEIIDELKRSDGRLTLPGLYRERKLFGFSLQELAEKAGTSASQIWRAEQGQMVRRDKAKRIAQAMYLSLDDLQSEPRGDE